MERKPEVDHMEWLTKTARRELRATPKASQPADPMRKLKLEQVAKALRRVETSQRSTHTARGAVGALPVIAVEIARSRHAGVAARGERGNQGARGDRDARSCAGGDGSGIDAAALDSPRRDASHQGSEP